MASNYLALNSQVFYIIDTLFDVSCRIQHIPKGEMKRYIGILRLYFEKFGGLVMMGGDIDASAKGLAGIHIVDNEAYLLVIVRRCGIVDKTKSIFEGSEMVRRASDSNVKVEKENMKNSKGDFFYGRSPC